MIQKSETQIEEIRNGYSYDAERDCYSCSACGEHFDAQEIFSIDGKLYTAKRAIELHIKEKHGSRLRQLLEADNRYLQLTSHQKNLLSRMAAGQNDAEIAKAMEMAPSTVRQQRFLFREKARQARQYLAVFELAFEYPTEEPPFCPVPDVAKMVDERYAITEQERQKTIKNAFSSLSPLRLRNFPPKEKKKLIILQAILEQFEKNRKYSESEVNEILQAIYDDYATLRRSLIEYGMMDRTRDCKEYWLR